MKQYLQILFLLVVHLLCVKSGAQSRTAELVNQLKENKTGTYYSYQEALSNPLAVIHLKVKHYYQMGAEIGCFSNLESIDFDWSNEYNNLPIELFQLKKLKEINIHSGGNPRIFPKEIANLTLLEYLRAPAAILPDEASALTRLKKIEVYSVSPGLEFSSLPNLESIGLCVFDSLNLAKIKRATQQVLVLNQKFIHELRLEQTKLTAASFRYIIQSLSVLPGIESLEMNYELTDSVDIEVKLPPGSFPNLKKLKVAPSTTNQFLFRQCQTIKSLEINGLFLSFFDIKGDLIKPFDITLGIKNLYSFSICFESRIHGNLNPLFKSLENQDSLFKLTLSGIRLQEDSSFSFNWLSNMKCLKSITLDWCENISLSSFFNTISSQQEQIKITMISCRWQNYKLINENKAKTESSYEITKINSQITEFNFWDTDYFEAFPWKMFPNVEYIFSDQPYLEYHKIESLRSATVIDTEWGSDTGMRIEVLQSNVNTKFTFIHYPIYRVGDHDPYFPQMSCWVPLITKSAVYYYGGNDPTDTTFGGSKLDVFWYPSGKKKYVRFTFDDYIYTEYFHENGRKWYYTYEEISPKGNGKTVLLYEVKWNETGDIVYYINTDIEQSYYYRILFYPNGLPQRIDWMDEGKKKVVHKYPRYYRSKRVRRLSAFSDQ